MHAIDELKQLDLVNYPLEEIDKFLSKRGNLAIMQTKFHRGKEIERAINNTKEEPEFYQVKRISFKPAELNSLYLRASTPKNTMFYGSVLSDDDEENKIKYNRMISSTETSSLIRNSDIIEGWSRITFGKWEVNEDVSLATIINPTKTYENKYLNTLKNRYMKFLEETSPDICANTIQWLEFLSEEFSKNVANGANHEYLISAKFSEIFTNTDKYDGVIYPSVRSNGYGFCVAIHPNSVSKLKLTKVLQCKLTKSLGPDNEFDYQLYNEKNCLVTEGLDEFKLKKI